MMTGPSMLDNLIRLQKFKTAQESSYDRTGGNEDYVSIEPGDKAVICDVDGPGQISRIWVTVASPDTYVRRTCVIRMFWDNEASPSVEAPLGDFFGVGFGQYKHYTALPMGMSSGGYYCYLPMPFAKSARIEIENQGNKKIYAFYYNITYHKLYKLEKDTAYFHALWRHDETRPGENYTLLEAEGRGHYAGCVMSMQGRVPLSLWFLEGDEMIYVDGEGHPPAVHGTGTEDYFNAGWYFNKGTFSAPFHGLTVKDWARARISAYRFHIQDPIPFEKSIRVTMEHGGTNDASGCHYDSVAYWYQLEPHKPHAGLPNPDERLPRDPPLERLGRRIAAEALDRGYGWGKVFVDLMSKRK